MSLSFQIQNPTSRLPWKSKGEYVSYPALLAFRHLPKTLSTENSLY